MVIYVCPRCYKLEKLEFKQMAAVTSVETGGMIHASHQATTLIHGIVLCVARNEHTDYIFTKFGAFIVITSALKCVSLAAQKLRRMFFSHTHT